MQVVKLDELEAGAFLSTALTIGAFDGVHLGHREIFKTLTSLARARKLLPTAITFQPLPREVLGNNNGKLAILSFDERKRRIEACGIELLVVVNFDKAFAQRSAEDFMDEVRAKLSPHLIVVGHDFRFGKDKSADHAWLEKYCQKYSIELKVISAFLMDGEPVSASRIRKLLKQGKLEEANQLLGEPYQLEGEVVHGHHRGKEMGFATANISWNKELLIPTGVYIARACFNDEKYPAVVNIGYNPTFGDKDLSIEAHLLDFSGDLYRKRLRIYLLKRLRDEIKFDSVDRLAEQIKKDIKKAKEYLGLK